VGAPEKEQQPQKIKNRGMNANSANAKQVLLIGKAAIKTPLKCIEGGKLKIELCKKFYILNIANMLIGV
jgi:hypothetical protein